MSDLAIAYEDERKWTYADYKEWELKPGERFELIDGVAYAMAGPNTEHQQLSMVLSAKLFNYFEGKPCRPFAAPFDVRLFYEEDETDDTVVQPDLVVVCEPEKLGKEGYRGAPSLVIEILSPSNTAIEMYRKLELYRSAGVKEYWIIDPEQKLVEIYRLNGDRYESYILHMGDTVQSTLFPGLAIPLETIFA
jgi:Uma2 family endonuclease